MSSSRHELNFIKAGFELLEPYLLSDQIYWPIGIRASSDHPAYPQFTLGTLTLFVHQADARLTDPALRIELAQKKTDIEAVHTHWMIHWQRKAAAEFNARLKLWKDYLEEYRKDSEGNYDRYAYEVTRRVLLHWLREDADINQIPSPDLLDQLDQILQANLVTGSFIWDSSLETEFPANTFWYLYGKLPPHWPGTT